jgi:hypothetical protein
MSEGNVIFLTEYFLQCSAGKKRRRAAALQDAGASKGTSNIPPGFRPRAGPPSLFVAVEDQHISKKTRHWHSHGQDARATTKEKRPAAEPAFHVVIGNP